MKPIVAITLGDFNGIGPELALKAAAHPSVKKICSPVVVGPFSLLQHVASGLSLKAKPERTALPMVTTSGIPVIDNGDAIPAEIAYGAPSKASGRAAASAIQKAVELCVSKKAAAMVTAPLAKESLHLAGYQFPGQTEMIAMLSRSQKYAMMLASPEMRVGLVTIHIPLRDVAAQVTRDRVVEKTVIVEETLRTCCRIAKPSIAVLALNPHAGENDALGGEENAAIRPAIESLKALGINAEGPFPADGFFATHAYKKYDAVMAMYHDQGLIPLKMLGFAKGVNVSAGLNIIRTSPDHGTAFDIAGKGKADISSMLEAIKLAVAYSANTVKGA